MEYQRKKVEKIKVQKPKKQKAPQKVNRNAPQSAKKPERRPDREYFEPEQDVGFDVEDIPMSPKKSSQILNENINKAPQHRDIRINKHNNSGRAVSDKGDSRIQTEKKGENLSLIIGGKLKRLRKRKKILVFSAIVLAAAVTLAITAALTPASLIELMQNNFTSWGSGDGMPVSVSGSKSLGMQTRNGTVFVLTDTRVYAYNRSGKQIQSIQHGYSNPELYVSDSRTLVYDRGGVKLRIDTLNTNIANKSLSQIITAATLSDSGRAGIITEGDKSVSQLVVSDDSFSKFTAWSSTERLCAVALSRNGKTAAVSAITSSSGTFKSIVYLLDISGDVITEKTRLEFNGTPIVTLETVGDRVIAAGTDFIACFDFDGGSRTDKALDYLKRVSFEPDNRIITVSNPSNNVRQTLISVMNRDLTEMMSVTVSENADNVCALDNGIAVVSGNTLIMYDDSGNETVRHDIGYEGVYIAPYRSGTVVMSDMQVNYYKQGD